MFKTSGQMSVIHSQEIQASTVCMWCWSLNPVCLRFPPQTYYRTGRHMWDFYWTYGYTAAGVHSFTESITKRLTALRFTAAAGRSNEQHGQWTRSVEASVQPSVTLLNMAMAWGKKLERCRCLFEKGELWIVVYTSKRGRTWSCTGGDSAHCFTCCRLWSMLTVIEEQMTDLVIPLQICTSSWFLCHPGREDCITLMHLKMNDTM